MAFAACDVPSTGPSIDTETGLSSPVVVDKTFTFLGGPKSEHEPLVDTTTSQFDSLFTAAESDQSLSIEEEVSSFDIGSLDQALDEATEGVGADTSISETVIQESDLATQKIEVDPFREENGIAEVPAPGPVATQVANTTRPFPPKLLAIPDFKVASVQADMLRRGRFTSEEVLGDGTEVNRLTFTLRNDASNPTPLTDGNGNGPTIRIEEPTGELVAAADFSDPIQAGDTEEHTILMAGKTLGKDSRLNLIVEGSDQDVNDELTLEFSTLRYQEATLEDNLQVDVSATRTNLATGGESQFAGIEIQDGTLQLDVTNNFRFPIQIDSLLLENNLQETPALPDSFETLDALKSSGSIAPGATQTLEVELADRGIARSIDVRVRGGLADDPEVLTAAATDNIEVSVGGALTVGAMFFWPDGEEVQANGMIDFEQDRISFDKSTDYVELAGGTLALDNLVSEPEVSFESFTLSFPEITSNQGDPLTLHLAGFPREIDKDLSDFRLSPTDNEVRYNLQGVLEETTEGRDDLRVIRFADEVRTDVSVGDLDVRALEAGVNPFSVDVTEDADGDGQLDLSDDAEAARESFDGFGDISESINGLQLSGSELKFKVTTNVGSDAQLFGALQGRGGSSRAFLAGKGDKSVPADAPLGDDLYSGTSKISRDNLIQFGIDAEDDPSTNITLTNENSTVDDFISTLPNVIRFAGQARLTGDADGQIRLRRPLQFDAGLSVSVPLTVNGSFTVEDTVDADFSSLEDVTDPEDDFSLSTAELRLKYSNQIPLGADANLIVLDEKDSEVLRLPSDGDQLRLEPAPKGSDGTASGTQPGTLTLDLSEEEVLDLSDGRKIRLVLDMDQAEGEGATLRATDTIVVSLEAKIKANAKIN